MSLLEANIIEIAVPAIDTSIWQRNEVTGVPVNVETTIFNYTVTDAILYLDQISMTGTYPAEYRVYKNATFMETLRTEITSPFAVAAYAPLKLISGDHVLLKVVHYDPNLPGVHSFEGTLKAHTL